MVLKMANWIIFSILALVSWGIWGFMMKLSINSIGCAKSVMVYQAIGSAVVVLLVLLFLKFRPEGDLKGIGLSVITGVLGMLGTLFFILAISSGNGTGSVVSPLTALYPLITIALALMVLKEPLSVKQGAGIVFAMAAMVLFTT